MAPQPTDGRTRSFFSRALAEIVGKVADYAADHYFQPVGRTR